MGRRSLRVADVVEVLEHWAAGRPLRAIAKSLGLDRNTVAKYVGPEPPPARTCANVLATSLFDVAQQLERWTVRPLPA